MPPENFPAASERPDRPWLFPLVLLLVATAAIVALTLTGHYAPHELRCGPRWVELVEPGASPWGAVAHNLAIACAYGLYALPVLGMAGLLAAGGFDWGLAGALMGISAAIFACGANRPDVVSLFVFPFSAGIVGGALLFGAVGGLLAGRWRWGVNRVALLNLPLGLALSYAIATLWPRERIHDGIFWPEFSWAAIAAAAAAMLLAAWLLLYRTASGRRLRAIGGGATAARLAGVNRGWALFLAFALSAVGAGFFGVNLRLLGTHSPFDFWGSWFLGLIWLDDLPPMTSEFIAVPLAHTFVFGVIVACGGGLAGRGRVSLAALACAALAVPMCDCALWWLNLAILEPPIIAIGAAAFWWRRRQRPAGTIGGVVGAAMAATMLDFGLRGFDLSNAHWLRGAVWLIVAGATVFFWWLGRERPAPIDC